MQQRDTDRMVKEARGLVRYIYLNVMRAGLVKDMEGLDGYRWSRHALRR